MNSKEKTNHVTNKAVSLIRALHNPSIGAKEFSGGWCPERCDAVLFDSSWCYMIETKISRSDFLADFKKPHRQGDRGVGNYKYYACPTGLIKPDELPPKWGLIYVDCDNKRNRASLKIGHGGWLDKAGQSHLLAYKREKEYHGCKPYSDDDLKKLFGHDKVDFNSSYNHPEQPHIKYRFDCCDYERNFLFALATRYKKQEFMENLL